MMKIERDVSIMLEIKHLTKYYGEIRGVENLDLVIEDGEIFGFIGPNGAGKSTTIRCIMHLIQASSGEIYVNHQKFNQDDLKIKRIIGYLPSEIHLYDDYTVKQILDYHESFYSDTHQRREELVKYLELDESKKIEDLSLGNLKKVGIILAFMHSPQLVILDEPTSGLDPIMQQKFYDLLLEEKKKGTTIFYSTHILSEVSKVCDRVGIIKEGHLIQVEKIEEIKNKSLVYVSVTSNQIDAIIEEMNIEVEERNLNTIKFKNMQSIDTLVKQLSKYTIDHLMIEEASIEDLFIHYYK